MPCNFLANFAHGFASPTPNIATPFIALLRSGKTGANEFFPRVCNYLVATLLISEYRTGTLARDNSVFFTFAWERKPGELLTWFSFYGSPFLVCVTGLALANITARIKR